MAIACDACGKPVHEMAVACPHCGGPTGVPADPIAEAEITMLPELAPPPRIVDPLPLDRVARGKRGAKRAQLPRAVARRRPK